MKTLFSLLYIVSFLALLAILDHRNTEISRWVYEREVARIIMMPDEPYMVMDLPININDIRVRK